jgi:hypothetical protein
MLTLPHRAGRHYAGLDKDACPILGKAPVYADGHGWRDATSDLATLDKLFLAREHTGVGIATGRKSGWVLDLDGPEGLASIRDLIRQHGSLPQGPVCVTGGGGFHLWFRFDDRCTQLRNRVKFADGLDIRTTGGGVVCPPSVHPDTGRIYQWRPGASLDDLEMPAAPQWLLSAIVGSYPAAAPIPQREAVTVTDRYAGGALVSAVQRIVAAGDGQQRRTLYTESLSIGARVVGPGLCPMDAAHARLVQAGMQMTNHRPQKWTQSAVQRIVIDGLHAGVGRVTHAA